MKTLILASLVAFSSMTHAEISPNNFWDTAAPATASVTYDALLKAQEYAPTTVYLNDTQHRVTLHTVLTVTSKSDNLIIDGLTVNRNNCKVYFKDHTETINSQFGPASVSIYTAKGEGYNITVPYGTQHAFLTDCTAEQLLEVTLVTPTNPLTWNFNN